MQLPGLQPRRRNQALARAFESGPNRSRFSFGHRTPGDSIIDPVTARSAERGSAQAESGGELLELFADLDPMGLGLGQLLGKLGTAAAEFRHRQIGKLGRRGRRIGEGVVED